VFDFLTHLFDTSDFRPRWRCGNWSEGHGWLHILSDLGVWSAYFTIPAILVYFVLRRKDVPFPSIFWLFGTFILACGTTHLMEAIIFWYPVYRLAGVIKLFTALISWATVAALVPVVPRALAMRSPSALEREIAARRSAETALQKANLELEQQVKSLRASEEYAQTVEGQRAVLEKNKQVLKLVHQIGKVGHWEWNSVTDQNTWSPELEALYGLPPGSFKGGYKGWAELVHPDDLPRAEEDVRRALETGKYTSEFRVVWPDSSVHWLEARATVFKDGHDKQVRIVGVNMDITERKNQEVALRASEQRWRTMAEALPNLVWTDLPDGQCDWLSSQWGKYTGIPENQLLGLRWLETLHPEDREHTVKCWNAACADEADYDLEYRIRRHDGDYHWFKTRGVPVRDDNGKIIYWFGTCTDIEDNKRAAEQLHDADRRKDEFLATLAHELRNPLAPIRNALELLSRAGTSAAVAEQARAIMGRQLDQLVRLVDDLLDMSRINQGKVRLHQECVELKTVVQSALEAVQLVVRNREHELTVNLPSEPVFLKVDSIRMAQVISNLLNNASKYTEKGGHISLIAQRHGREAVITVRDTGIGIAPDHLPHLFEMFSQLTPALERSQGGLGVGLSLVKGLVELHGGRVEAYSDGIGKGSEFTIRLPVVDAPASTESPSAKTDKTDGTRKRRVLAVDDNRDSADSLALMLQKMGHETQTAYDGLEALQAAESMKPEVLLLDIGLPKMNGYEVAQQIRQQPWGKNMTLIALTGWGQQEDKRRTLEAGFDHHLTKPVDARVLESLLNINSPEGLKPNGPTGSSPRAR
jgi:PAS domain S-box-containing protein